MLFYLDKVEFFVRRSIVAKNGTLSRIVFALISNGKLFSARMPSRREKLWKHKPWLGKKAFEKWEQKKIGRYNWRRRGGNWIINIHSYYIFLPRIHTWIHPLAPFGIINSSIIAYSLPPWRHTRKNRQNWQMVGGVGISRKKKVFHLAKSVTVFKLAKYWLLPFPICIRKLESKFLMKEVYTHTFPFLPMIALNNG